jgi:hypothetical protein
MRTKCARCGGPGARPDLTALANLVCLPVGTALLFALGRSVVNIRHLCPECGQHFFSEVRRSGARKHERQRGLAATLMVVSTLVAFVAAFAAHGPMLAVAGIAFAAGVLWVVVMDAFDAKNGRKGR